MRNYGTDYEYRPKVFFLAKCAGMRDEKYMGYGNAVIFKRAESNRKRRVCRVHVYVCVNIGEVYVTPPFFHETITYLPTEIIFPE